MKQKMDLAKLEAASFKIGKDAFSPKVLSCCGNKMRKTAIEISLSNDILIKVNGFECNKCRKKYLGLEEAKKLDKALIVSRVLEKDFRMKRSLSFDGDNYTFRIPKEFTHNVRKNKIEILPLGAKEFCATVE
ncbi:MAG: hypothetical protein ABIF10_02890 [Candidatus Woesearchaeota archaeon]